MLFREVLLFFFFVRERNDVGFPIQREKFFIIPKATMTRKWHALNITALRNMRAGDSAFFFLLYFRHKPWWVERCPADPDFEGRRFVIKTVRGGPTTYSLYALIEWTFRGRQQIKRRILKLGILTVWTAQTSFEMKGFYFINIASSRLCCATLLNVNCKLPLTRLSNGKQISNEWNLNYL